MKRKIWIILIISLILVTIAAICLGSANSAFKKASQTKQIDKMAQYLNDKYGYDVSADDCIYFREQDYGHHIKFIYKVKNNIPYIAIFENNGERITVTDRQGFLGDDGQLDEVSGLITEYFERLTDLPIEYVELKSKFENDKLVNEILHHEFNEKLTEKNIGQFVEHMANRHDTVNALLYFKAEENLQSQLEEITSKLESIDELGLDGSIRFYITDMDELHVQYNAPMVHLLTESSAKFQSNEDYIWGNYQVVNDIEHRYTSGYGPNFTIADVEYNSFVAAGYYVPYEDNPHEFVERQIEIVNDFGVVDLSYAALVDYLKEMESYGVWHGCTILLKAGNDEGNTTLTIDGGNKKQWCFRWNTGSMELYAFKHGRLVELDQARVYHWVDNDDLDEILEKHKENFEAHYNKDYEDFD
jgi:hypothetical protein